MNKSRTSNPDTWEKLAKNIIDDMSGVLYGYIDLDSTNRMTLNVMPPEEDEEDKIIGLGI